MNLAKTKVTVCRNGGKLSSKEKLSYNGKTFDIVSHYKYSGIAFNWRLTGGGGGGGGARNKRASRESKQSGIDD